MSTPEEAQRAITEMNSRIIPGQKKPLFVALHEPKEIRRQKLAHRHNLAMTKNIRGVQPMYGPQGQPMFYPNGNVPQGFIYPQQVTIPPMQPRNWGPNPQFQPVASGNYITPGVMGNTRGNTRQNTGSAGNTGSGVGTNTRAPQRGGRSGNRRGQQPAPIEGQMSELTLAFINQYPPEQQKLLLGERLYPLIVPSQGMLAGKITGMFLDSGWSVEELFSLLHDDSKLQQKIESALEVLARAQVVGDRIE